MHVIIIIIFLDFIFCFTNAFLHRSQSKHKYIVLGWKSHPNMSIRKMICMFVTVKRITQDEQSENENKRIIFIFWHMHEYKCNSSIISDGKQEEHFHRIYLSTCWDTKLGLFFILFLFPTSNTEYFYPSKPAIAFHHFLFIFDSIFSRLKKRKKVSSFQIIKHSDCDNLKMCKHYIDITMYGVSWQSVFIHQRKWYLIRYTYLFYG